MLRESRGYSFPLVCLFAGRRSVGGEIRFGTKWHSIEGNALRRTEYEDHRATIRTALGELAFAEACSEGRAMSPERAVAYALEETLSA